MTVQPALELRVALIGVSVELGVNPFAEGRLDEAFSVAVGLRGAGPGADMAQTEFLAGGAEGARAVAAAVVCHDALAAGTEAGVAGLRSLPGRPRRWLCPRPAALPRMLTRE